MTSQNIVNVNSFNDTIYLNSTKNLHPELNDIITHLPNNINDLRNIIMYGSLGIGKYTQALKIVHKYSPSGLAYEKKINLHINKNDYNFKISDIHIEIDMELLGCNAKTVWNEIINQIIFIALSKNNKNFIVICKNFQEIHYDLRDIFYVYSQSHKHSPVRFIFFLLTTQLSIVPDDIRSMSLLLPIKRPNNKNYKEITQYKKNDINFKNISNIKELELHLTQTQYYDNLVELLIHDIEHHKTTQFSTIRDHLYNLLVYNINLHDSFTQIILSILKKYNLPNKKLYQFFVNLYISLKLYNNNYRSIYHLELLIIQIVELIS